MRAAAVKYTKSPEGAIGRDGARPGPAGAEGMARARARKGRKGRAACLTSGRRRRRAAALHSAVRLDGGHPRPGLIQSGPSALGRRRRPHRPHRAAPTLRHAAPANTRSPCYKVDETRGRGAAGTRDAPCKQQQQRQRSGGASLRLQLPLFPCLPRHRRAALHRHRRRLGQEPPGRQARNAPDRPGLPTLQADWSTRQRRRRRRRGPAPGGVLADTGGPPSQRSSQYISLWL